MMGVCPRCGHVVADDEPMPDEFYIVVDRKQHRSRYPTPADEYALRTGPGVYRTKEIAQGMGVVAGRAVYKCVRAGSTDGTGSRGKK